MKQPSTGKVVANILGLSLLIGVISVGVVATQNAQIFKPSASEGGEMAVSGIATPPPSAAGAVTDTGGLQESQLATAAVTSLVGRATVVCTKTARLWWPRLFQSVYGLSGYQVWLWEAGSTNQYMRGIAASTAATINTVGPAGFRLNGTGAAMPALKLNKVYYAQVGYLNYSRNPNERFGNRISFRVPAVCN